MKMYYCTNAPGVYLCSVIVTRAMNEAHARERIFLKIKRAGLYREGFLRSHLEVKELRTDQTTILWDGDY